MMKNNKCFHDYKRISTCFYCGTLICKNCYTYNSNIGIYECRPCFRRREFLALL